MIEERDNSEIGPFLGREPLPLRAVRDGALSRDPDPYHFFPSPRGFCNLSNLALVTCMHAADPVWVSSGVQNSRCLCGGTGNEMTPRFAVLQNVCFWPLASKQSHRELSLSNSMTRIHSLHNIFPHV